MFKNIKTAQELAEEKLAQEKQKQLSEAKQYLSNTDWYYARKLETGEELPVDVAAKRLEARELINKEVV